jgi:hypothetical protein
MNLIDDSEQDEVRVPSVKPDFKALKEQLLFGDSHSLLSKVKEFIPVFVGAPTNLTTDPLLINDELKFKESSDSEEDEFGAVLMDVSAGVLDINAAQEKILESEGVPVHTIKESSLIQEMP